MQNSYQKIKHICFVLDGYPYKGDNNCVFARNLIYEIADLGIRCTVISPMILTPSNLKKKIPYYRSDCTKNGSKIDVYTPIYIHFSSKRGMMGMSMRNHYYATLKTIRKEKLDIDCIYGHFIYQNGLTAARVGEKLKILSFCAVGENSTRLTAESLPYFTGLKYHNWTKILSKLTGIISVSNYNLNLLYQNGFFETNINSLVCPNGVNKRIFYPADLKTARERLHLPQNSFIIAFVGAFSQRKGIGVLCEALNRFDDAYLICIGKGELKGYCKNVIFTGSVSNENLADYLNASDVFVLPTLGEGCCNAILEALACGKPVISSDLPFNDDILDETNSIRVNPTDVDEIVTAISRLKNNLEERAVLSNHEKRVMDISERAKKILRFIGVDL